MQNRTPLCGMFTKLVIANSALQWHSFIFHSVVQLAVNEAPIADGYQSLTESMHSSLEVTPAPACIVSPLSIAPLGQFAVKSGKVINTLNVVIHDRRYSYYNNRVI